MQQRWPPAEGPVLFSSVVPLPTSAVEEDSRTRGCWGEGKGEEQGRDWLGMAASAGQRGQKQNQGQGHASASAISSETSFAGPQQLPSSNSLDVSHSTSLRVGFSEQGPVGYPPQTRLTPALAASDDMRPSPLFHPTLPPAPRAQPCPAPRALRKAASERRAHLNSPSIPTALASPSESAGLTCGTPGSADSQGISGTGALAVGPGNKFRVGSSQQKPSPIHSEASSPGVSPAHHFARDFPKSSSSRLGRCGAWEGTSSPEGLQYELRTDESGHQQRLSPLCPSLSSSKAEAGSSYLHRSILKRHPGSLGTNLDAASASCTSSTPSSPRAAGTWNATLGVSQNLASHAQIQKMISQRRFSERNEEIYEEYLREEDACDNVSIRGASDLPVASPIELSEHRNFLEPDQCSRQVTGESSPFSSPLCSLPAQPRRNGMHRVGSQHRLSRNGSVQAASDTYANSPSSRDGRGSHSTHESSAHSPPSPPNMLISPMEQHMPVADRTQHPARASTEDRRQVLRSLSSEHKAAAVAFEQVRLQSPDLDAQDVLSPRMQRRMHAQAQSRARQLQSRNHLADDTTSKQQPNKEFGSTSPMNQWMGHDPRKGLLNLSIQVDSSPGSSAAQSPSVSPLHQHPLTRRAQRMHRHSGEGVRFLRPAPALVSAPTPPQAPLVAGFGGVGSGVGAFGTGGVGGRHLEKRASFNEGRRALGPRMVLLSEPRSMSSVFITGKVIGEGQFGTIRKVESRQTGKLFACKTISKASLKSKGDVEDVRNEHTILRMMATQPNVCQLLDTFEDERDVHFVLELCEGGDLFDRLKLKRSYSEPEAAVVLRTVLRVLQHCHRKRIVHRDIKPENVLLTSTDNDTDVKVIDFGIATIMKKDGSPLTEVMGSLLYIAPEVLCGHYGCAADVWSAGVLLYVLLTGSPPFWAKAEQDLVLAIKTGQFRFSRSRPISDGAKHLILQMLSKDPWVRVTAEEALTHPWIVSACAMQEKAKAKKPAEG